MAEETELYKMNVRSPFYVVVKDEGKPTGISEEDPDDQTDDDQPDAPDEYVEPDEQTEIVRCGDTVNVGEDVGVRFFRLDTQGVTGDFTVNYRVNAPIRITATSGSTTDLFNGNRFIGSNGLLSVYRIQLLAAGIDSGNMALTDGEATGSFTFTKTDNGDNYIKFKVEAPIITDDYSLTFNCPSVTFDTTLTNPGNRGIVQTVFGIQFEQRSSSGNPPSIHINGTQVVAQAATDSRIYMIDDNDLGSARDPRSLVPTTTTYIPRSSNFKKGINTVELRFRNPNRAWYIRFSRFGIFHDGTSFKHSWAGSENTYSEHKTHPYEANSHAFHSGIARIAPIGAPSSNLLEYTFYRFYVYDDGSGNAYLTMPDGKTTNPRGNAVYFTQPYEFAQAFHVGAKERRSGANPIVYHTNEMGFIRPFRVGGYDGFQWFSKTD